jgi:hypothetical protein
MDQVRKLLHGIGSLWLATMLLVLLLVGMACATVFEATNGTEQALRAFYGATWFRALLALFALNVAAAVITRFPFSRHLSGFVIAHGSILVVVLGALASQYRGVEGMVGLAEGESTTAMTARGESAVTVLDPADGSERTIDLDGRIFGGFEEVRSPGAPELTLGDLRVTVEHFLPDSEWTSNFVETDQPYPPAAAVRFGDPEHVQPVWVSERQPALQDGVPIVMRSIPDAATWQRLIETPAATDVASQGRLKVQHGDASLEIPLERVRGGPVPIEGTECTVRVARYFPNAKVGREGRLTNVSDRAENPAVEVELTGPAGVERRVCFARFPGFRHSETLYEGIELTFISKTDNAPAAPLEVLVGPQGELLARFSREGTETRTAGLTVGEPVDTPWVDRRFTVETYYAHARPEWSLQAVWPVRERRRPAVRLALAGSAGEETIWLQKYRARQWALGAAQYELLYTDRRVPLGFAVQLNRFRIGTYPGGNRPRSFESHVTLTDPITGRQQDHVISMNRPAEFRGFTLYQSSYSDEGGQMYSYLSVSRDPGRPIVFAGYIAMMLGMLVLIVTRLRTRLRTSAATASLPRADAAEPSSDSAVTPDTRTPVD